MTGFWDSFVVGCTFSSVVCVGALGDVVEDWLVGRCWVGVAASCCRDTASMLNDAKNRDPRTNNKRKYTAGMRRMMKKFVVRPYGLYVE